MNLDPRDFAFLKGLPPEPLEAVKTICARFFSFDGQLAENQKQKELAKYVQHIALAEVYLDANGLRYDKLNLAKYAPEDIPEAVRKFFYGLSDDTEQTITLSVYESFKSAYSRHIGKRFLYEFTDGDLSRVQQLINELRGEIASSALFEDSHRARLLARLEKVQSELHKKVSDLDKFWGLVGDAGVAMGKFGKDAKPIVDRIREIADIIWRTQARAEELPSNAQTPLLVDKDKGA